MTGTINFEACFVDKVVKLSYNMTTNGGCEMKGLFIRPSKDIRIHYAQISELTRENPVAITVNGREDTVIVSHEDYMAQQRKMADMQAELEIYRHLAESRDDIELGRVRPAASVLDDLRREIASGR